jgi:hypothetical protein
MEEQLINVVVVWREHEFRLSVCEGMAGRKVEVS